MITSEQFFQFLRSALNHLYDPNFLRKSPLVKEFGMDDQPDTSSALQRILNEAIADLEPKTSDPNLKQRMKSYELIMYRYVQQFDQEEVATQLGMSVRHLRREQNTAIYQLAALLWEKYHLGSRPFQMSSLDAEDGAGESATGASSDAGVQASQESDWDWLMEVPLEEPASLELILSDVIELSRPLAERYQVPMSVHWDSNIPGLAIQKVALRQILINILSALISRQNVSKLTISAQLENRKCVVQFHSTKEIKPFEALNEDAKTNLDISRRLVGFYGGEMTTQLDDGSIYIVIKIPLFQQRLVLVIDDNVDFIQLIERSVTGTRYQVIGERDPWFALSAAERNLPDIIFLDVMMPKVDGWEVLGRLRQHPKTTNIPVVVCSILPQEEFALSLGAKEFLRKPLTQERIISVLDRLTGLPEQESR